MCFSATASFTASAALTTSGIISLWFAFQSNRRFIPINLLSFFFAIQQFSEGMNWIGSPFLTPSIWGGLFLFFAFFVYSWYFAFSCYLITAHPLRKKWIQGIALCGFLYGIVLFSLSVFTSDFSVSANAAEHIQYHLGGIINHGALYKFLIFIYVLLCSAPCFLSDRRGTNLLGWVIIFSATVSWIIYLEYFISVWCFYAAMIALTISAITCAQWWQFTRKFR